MTGKREELWISRSFRCGSSRSSGGGGVVGNGDAPRTVGDVHEQEPEFLAFGTCSSRKTETSVVTSHVFRNCTNKIVLHC